jgi:exodeoxyribonuclease V gamma subunit
MSINLKISNSLEKLADALGDHILEHPLPVFSHELIITQTTGMNRWLSIFLAERNKVFANFEFLRPNTFIDKIFALAGIEHADLYQPEFLKWIFFSILDAADFQKRFPDVAAYYRDDEMKRLQLSGKVADLFDQYSIYRPDYLEAWGHGRSHPELKDLSRQEKWQSWLWQKLKSDFPGEQDRVTQANQLKDIIRHDPSFKKQLTANFSRVTVFGLSVITPLHIEIFNLLSEHLEILFYAVNPSPETYWYDTKSDKQLAAIADLTGEDPDDLFFEKGNELLSNYGKVVRDAFLLLFDEQTLNTLDDSLVVEWPADTLLEKIQDDICQNRKDDRNTIEVNDLDDHSLQISSSYTEVRELEALHNQLLFLFKKDGTLLPKDIIVLTPDIDLYTPYIKAVFDNVPAQNRIPYSIADRSYSGGDTLTGIIELLLDLTEETFSSERVVQLLDSAHIRKSYAISDIQLIRDMVRRANIRTGIEGAKDDDTYLVSWSHGIRRLILGYAMIDAADYREDDALIYPVEYMEGEAARETLRFVGLVEDLIESLKQRTESRTLAGWKEYLSENVVNRFFKTNNEDDREFKYVLDKMAAFDTYTGYFGGKVDFKIFRKALKDTLFSETRSGNFITGFVTFSTMIPMRSLPFRVIAVLGLDNKKFPRTITEPAFNLITAKPRRGDRNIKDNDKHLFLETLLAAGDHLYLSYKGNDIRDNSELPPSLLIDELIDYIEKSYTGETHDVKKKLITRHPLHAFSQKYNEDNPKLFFFRPEDQQEKSMPVEGVAVAEQDFSAVSLDQMIRFFKNPFKWYYNRSLSIYYDEAEMLLPEYEIFQLNNLEIHNLKDILIRYPETAPRHTLAEEGKKTGLLPLGNMAEISVDTTWESVADIKAIFGELVKGHEEETEHINLQVGDTTITGFINGIYGGNQIAYSLSGSEKKESSRKYILDAWLKHLFLTAAGKPRNTLFIWKATASPVVVPHNLMTQSAAMNLLSDITRLFISGHQQLIPFDPAISFNLVYGRKDAETRFRELKGIGETNFNKDFCDAYYRKEIEQGFFSEEDPRYADRLELFQKVAEKIWLPLYRHHELFK